MPRLSASIVIPVWNAWETTQACLDSLKPTLVLPGGGGGGRGGVVAAGQKFDEVIVVDNGSVDATSSRLGFYPWVKVITNESNRGFGAACNQGAEVAGGDVVVFLNNDTVVTPKWIDMLLRPFSDEKVGATGPMSNFVSGPQLIEVPYGPNDMDSMRKFARSFHAKADESVTPVNRLVGFCLAVRTAALNQVGFFDEAFGIGGFEDDDLSSRLLHAGWKLLITHGAFVHHEGHKTFDTNGLDWLGEQDKNKEIFLSKKLAPRQRAKLDPDNPLISACMIVKDEGDSETTKSPLRECLHSLRGFADEVVVYDTGSTDNTVEIAKEYGARVELGYWDDDFSRARNASLEHCKGKWILWVDADEAVRCDDPQALREKLADQEYWIYDGFQISIDNHRGKAASSFVHVAIRMFDRESCHWAGRLHEQVMKLDSEVPVVTYLPEIRLAHSGYLPEMFTERKKAERNLRIAEAEAKDPAKIGDRAFYLTSLARAQWSCGKPEEALESALEAYDIAKDQVGAHPITKRMALRTAIQIATTDLRDFAKAEELIATLRESCTIQYLPDSLEGSLCMTRAHDLLSKEAERQRNEDGEDGSFSSLGNNDPHRIEDDAERSSIEAPETEVQPDRDEFEYAKSKLREHLNPVEKGSEAAGYLEKAIEVLSRVDTYIQDDDGFEYGPNTVAPDKALALYELGRYRDAAQVILDVLVARSVIDSHIYFLATCLVASGQDLAKLVDAIPIDSVHLFLGEMMQIPAGFADRLLEASFERWPEELAVLVAAAPVAPRLGIARALVWSSRFRNAGVAKECPLAKIARSQSAAPTKRIRAIAVLAKSFGDYECVSEIDRIFQEMSQDERDSAIADTSAICPELLGYFPVPEVDPPIKCPV